MRRFFILFLLGILLPLTASHAASNITFSPQVSIPSDNKFMVGQNYTFTDNTDRGIADYTISLFKYLLIVVVSLAILSVIIGGVMYLTAAGNSKSEAEARAYVIAGLSGAALTVCAYLLLATINTDLVNLKLDSIKSVDYVAPPPPASELQCVWQQNFSGQVSAGICNQTGFTKADNGKCGNNSEIVPEASLPTNYMGTEATNASSTFICCCPNVAALSDQTFCQKAGEGATCEMSNGQYGYCENISGQGLICRSCKTITSGDTNWGFDLVPYNEPAFSENQKCYRGGGWECPDKNGMCGNMSHGSCDARYIVPKLQTSNAPLPAFTNSCWTTSTSVILSNAWYSATHCRCE